MCVVSISDTHMRHDMLIIPQECELLILTGDFTNYGTFDEAKEVNEWLGKVSEHNKNIKEILVILGNHEGYGDIVYGESSLKQQIELHKKMINNKQKFDEYYAERIKVFKTLFTNATILYEESKIINGIKFYGIPWINNSKHAQDFLVAQYTDMGFHLSENKIIEKWNLIPKDTDFLLIHEPPYGILDVNGKGCLQLRSKLAEFKNLKVVQFGHVHSAYGYTFIHYNDLIFNHNIDIANNNNDNNNQNQIKQFQKCIKYNECLQQFVSNKNNEDEKHHIILFINGSNDGFEQPFYFKLKTL